MKNLIMYILERQTKFVKPQPPAVWLPLKKQVLKKGTWKQRLFSADCHESLRAFVGFMYNFKMEEKQNPDATTVTAAAEQIIIGSCSFLSHPGMLQFGKPKDPFASQRAVIEKLAELRPNTFFIEPEQRKPLKIGIFEELLEAHPEFTKTQLRHALKFYCRDSTYLKSIQRHTHRIGLNGEPAQEITAAEKESAKAKLSPKTPKTAGDADMADRSILTLAANRKNPSAAAPDTATASAKSAKITLVLDTHSISRVNSEGKKQVPFEIQAGGMKFKTLLNSKSYRKAIAGIDELGADNCHAIMQGSMPRFGELEGAGLVIQAKKATGQIESSE